MQNLKSKDLILALATDDFRQYFDENIRPHLYEIEEIRKNRKQFNLVCAVVGIIAAIIAFVHFMPLLEDPFGRVFTVIVMVIIFSWAFRGSFPTRRDYKRKIKEKFMQSLFSYWGDFQYLYPESIDVRAFREFIKNLLIFERYDDIVMDDCLRGHYNGLRISIMETDISYTVQNGKSSTTHQVFDGMVISASMNKNFNGHTVIRNDLGFANPKVVKHLERIALEDVEFEKKFEVYSNDQVEARYLITPSFMKRLVDWTNRNKVKTLVVFKDGEVHILADYRKDMFELPLDTSATDFKNYQRILVEFAQMLSIVDALKLEQDIGL